MAAWIRDQICRALRLPPDPEAPFGAPGSVRIFRAGRNYYWFCLGRWAFKQAFVMTGLVISTVLVWTLVEDLRSLRDDPATPVNLHVLGPTGLHRSNPPRKLTERLLPHVGWIIPLLTLLKGIAVIVVIAQLITTYVMQRLAYELRWYIVTDRSLRIRAGIWNLQETTMSFANLQQVEFSQGPLQRLLGLADLHVQSAGGGEQKEGSQKGESLHTGVFEGVTNAKEIRDLILTRLRDYRDSGLGHPAEAQMARLPAPLPLVPGDGAASLAAAFDLLAEARELRRALTSASASVIEVPPGGPRSDKTTTS